MICQLEFVLRIQRLRTKVDDKILTRAESAVQ